VATIIGTRTGTVDQRFLAGTQAKLMSTRNVSLNALRTFDAAARHASFTAERRSCT